MAGVELVAGALLGLAFSELWKAVKDMKNRASDFKHQLGKLDQTLRYLKPRIEHIKRIDTKLKESDQREIKRLTSILKKGSELVSRCLRVSPWNIWKKSSYQKKLVELDNDILRFHNIHLQLGTFQEVKKVRLELRSGFDKLSDQIQRLTSSRATTKIIGRFGLIILSVLNICMILLSTFREVKPVQRSRFIKNYNRMQNAWVFPINHEAAPRVTTPSMGMLGLIIFFVLIIYRSKTAIISMLDKCESGIWMVIKDVATLKTTIKKLDATVKSLVLVLDKEMESNSELTKRLRSLLEEGVTLVSECSKIERWNFVKQWQYQRKVVEFENKLLRFCSSQLQVSLASDVMMLRQMTSDSKKDESFEPARYDEDRHRKKGRRGKKQERGAYGSKKAYGLSNTNDNRFQLLD